MECIKYFAKRQIDSKTGDLFEKTLCGIGEKY
jgi:hypothetical protein